MINHSLTDVLHLTQRAITRSPYLQLIGLKANVDAQGIYYHLPFAEHNIGNASLPALHGGAIAALLEGAGLIDTQMALLEKQHQTRAKPVNYAVDYLRSAKAVDTFARTQITRMGLRVIRLSVHAWQSHESQPIAIAKAHLLIDGAD